MIIPLIISQSNNETSTVRESVHFVENLFRVSDGNIHKKGMIWADRKTFFAAHKVYTYYKNQIQSLRYDHSNGSFYYTTVGDGTTIEDESNHPAAWIWFENNRLYTGQVNTHNDPIDVFKSNVDNDNNAGFTELSQISDALAYPQFWYGHDGTLLCCVRWDVDKDTGLLISDAGIEGTWSAIHITDRNSEHADRYYNSLPKAYGTRTKTYVMSQMRNESTALYYAQLIYVTYDYETFWNYEETHSEDCSLGGISVTNLDDYYSNFNGDRTTRTTYINYADSVQVGDVLYVFTIKSGTSDLYIFKIDEGVKTEVLFDIDETVLDANVIQATCIDYNGHNLLLSVLVDDGAGGFKKQLYATPLDLSSFVLKYESTLQDSRRPIDLPDNMDEIVGEYAFELDINTDIGKLTLGLTQDKFTI